MMKLHTRTVRLSFMIVLNFLCFIMEIIIGSMCHSMVLTTDAFNVLSDFLGVVIALVSLKISGKGPSERNTFGWTRCDVLGALINSVFMLALCVTIFIGSCQLFVQPEIVDNPVLVAIVGGVGLAVNLVGLFVLKDYSSIPKHEKQQVQVSSVSVEKDANNSYVVYPEITVSAPSTTPVVPSNPTKNKHGASSRMNMYGAFLHVLGDALGSVVVIICAIIDWKVDNAFLQNYLDPILSVFVALGLALSSAQLMKESSLTLLQAVPTTVNLNNLKSQIMAKSTHIVEIKDLHVWQLTSEHMVASARIVFDQTLPLPNMVTLVTEIEGCFYAEGVHMVTVHPELKDGGAGGADMLTINRILRDSRRRRCSRCSDVDIEIPGITRSPDNHLRASVHRQLSSKSSGGDSLKI